MATNNPHNPNNEPCKQMLLDSISTAQERHIPQADIDVLQNALKILQRNQALSTAINQRWYSHRVPDQSVQYIQSRTLDKCQERYTRLTAEEERLLSLLERIQDPMTGCVLIKKSYIADLCHMSQREARRIQAQLDKLANIGFISWLYRPEKGSRSYGVIRIHPNVSWIGSNKRISHVSLNVPPVAPEYQQAAEYVIINDERIRCGTLIHCETIADKKMADATTSIDHQGTANPKSQSHNIRDHQKNQGKSCSAFNMQNGMTAEENELFSQDDEQPENSA